MKTILKALYAPLGFTVAIIFISIISHKNLIFENTGTFVLGFILMWTAGYLVKKFGLDKHRSG